MSNNRVFKWEIERGDHIYTWRDVFKDALHGIYIGNNKVIYYIPEEEEEEEEEEIETPTKLFSFKGSTSECQSSCPNLPDCGFRKPDSFVTMSCLDCFLGSGFPYRTPYGTKGSSVSDPPNRVVDRAISQLKNGFVNYDVLRNSNDFAVFCKIGMKSLDNNGESDAEDSSFKNVEEDMGRYDNDHETRKGKIRMKDEDPTMKLDEGTKFGELTVWKPPDPPKLSKIPSTKRCAMRYFSWVTSTGSD